MKRREEGLFERTELKAESLIRLHHNQIDTG